MEHGTVTSVKYEEGAVVCSVQAIRVDTEYDNVAVLKPHSGFIQVPEQGETVAMHELNDGTRFITSVISKESGFPDDMGEGDLAIQLDSDTRVRFEKQSNGDYNLHLNASGEVFIDGLNFDEHVHDFEDTTIQDTGDGSGGESTTTKKTMKPKNP
jgi:hypothetical protein